MDTLYDLTRRRSGIIIKDNKRYVVPDWTHIYGMPIQFPDGVYGAGEEIPAVPGHYFYNIEDADIDLSGLDYGDRPEPQRVTVYDLGGALVVCPDGWK